jgi:hypothetical protein
MREREREKEREKKREGERERGVVLWLLCLTFQSLKLLRCETSLVKYLQPTYKF